MEQQRKLKRNRSWLEEEDDKLREEVSAKPKQNWKNVARKAGLNRSGNSCRLRWFNHLKPGYRPGKLTDEEKLLILEFRSLFRKNCWAKIKTHLLPGRSDNDIKNFWHTLAKKAKLEKCDVESEAMVKKAELVEKITAAGKFSKDYSSLISPNAYAILKRLLPDLALTAATAVEFSSTAAADIGGADALISDYSPHLGPTTEVRHEFPNPFWGSYLFPDIELVQQQVMGTGGHGAHQNEWEDLLLDYGGDQGAATGFNQAPAPASIRGALNDTGNPHNSYAEVDQWVPSASAEARAARV